MTVVICNTKYISVETTFVWKGIDTKFSPAMHTLLDKKE